MFFSWLLFYSFKIYYHSGRQRPPCQSGFDKLLIHFFKFVFLVVFLLCLTKLWIMVERRRALTLPFIVDRDKLVCVKQVFEIFNFHSEQRHSAHVNLWAFSMQQHWFWLLIGCWSQVHSDLGLFNGCTL